MYSSTSAEATHTDAAVAQSVERRIGSAEVTGPIPVSSFIEKKRKSLNERVCAFLCYGVTVLRYYDECIVMEVWMRGEYTVEALMLSRGQGESRKTFSRLRPGVLFLSGIMSTFFHSFWVWHALFLFWDPIFASIRVWFALFLFSDPGCSSLLALCQPFSHSLRVWHAIFLLWNFAFSFYQTRIPICLTILHTFFNTASYLFHIYPVS